MSKILTIILLSLSLMFKFSPSFPQRISSAENLAIKSISNVLKTFSSPRLRFRIFDEKFRYAFHFYPIFIIDESPATELHFKKVLRL